MSHFLRAQALGPVQFTADETSKARTTTWLAWHDPGLSRMPLLGNAMSTGTVVRIEGAAISRYGPTKGDPYCTTRLLSTWGVRDVICPAPALHGFWVLHFLNQSMG